MRGRVALFLFGLTLPFVAFAADRTPAPLPAEKAAKTSVLPDGFTMTVFAAEPDVTQPISTLTVQVFTYAISPYQDWHRQAWAGALVLVTIVFLCSVLARVATARMERMQRGS